MKFSAATCTAPACGTNIAIADLKGYVPVTVTGSRMFVVRRRGPRRIVAKAPLQRRTVLRAVGGLQHHVELPGVKPQARLLNARSHLPYSHRAGVIRVRAVGAMEYAISGTPGQRDASVG